MTAPITVRVWARSSEEAALIVDATAPTPELDLYTASSGPWLPFIAHTSHVHDVLSGDVVPALTYAARWQLPPHAAATDAETVDDDDVTIDVTLIHYELRRTVRLAAIDLVLAASSHAINLAAGVGRRALAARERLSAEVDG